MDKQKRFKFKILPELKLIVESWSGEFTLREIIELKKNELLDPNWNASFDVLSDSRKILINLDFLDEDTSSYIPISQDFIQKRKTAHLTETPEQVLASSLLNLNKSEQILVEIKIFSTVEAALIWLNLNLKEKERIENLFEELGE